MALGFVGVALLFVPLSSGPLAQTMVPRTLAGTSWKGVEIHGATGKLLALFSRRQPESAAGTSSLEGTAWQLTRFQGGDDRILTPDDPAKYTIEFAAGGRLAVRVDCNRGRSTWKATETHLEGDGDRTVDARPVGSDPREVPRWFAARSDRRALGRHPVVRDEGRPSVPLADGRRRHLRARTDETPRTLSRRRERQRSHQSQVAAGTAAGTSVWTKSSPFHRSVSPTVIASAYEKQSP
jgi:META domain